MGDTADGHVGIPDRLDLLHAVAFGQAVEPGEDPVQHAHQVGRVVLAPTGA
jgi:hypothetical protein